MPVVFRHQGFRLHFYANEGDPREPVHIHVRRGRDNAKFWLHPEVRLAYNFGFDRRELLALQSLIEPRVQDIEDFWNGFFSA